MDKILVTGSSGFIGMHLCKSLLEDNLQVLGIDNMNDYYDVKLKEARLSQLLKYDNFHFKKADICDSSAVKKAFLEFKPNKVVNLAAQAGVRYSLENPQAYIETNIVGFMNILEACRKYEAEGLIYASSSSVYGGNKKSPFSVSDSVDKPISIYAVSKKTNELMAHSYNHLYGLSSTGLRFFTVYGPWGRPDMAMYIFAKKISMGENIPVFNHGNMRRDFTYIDDITRGIRASIEKNYNYEVFNLGNNISEDLMDMVDIINNNLSKKSKINFMDMQLGDVQNTHADIEYSKKMLDYNPVTPISIGIPNFIEWFKAYHKIK